MVVARSDVDDERAKGVERRAVAELDFLIDLLLDLVERHVAGAFDHDLNVVLPGFVGEFAERLEFGELRLVAGVGDAAGAKAVAERIGDVVLLQDLGDVVEALVEEVLFVVVGHPLRQDGAAAADDAGDALGDHRQVLDEDAGVDGHVVDALLRLLFDDFEHEVGGEVFDALHARDRLVDRHGADGHGRVAEDGFADLVDVAAGGEIHDGVCAVVDGGVQLLEFGLDVGGDGGVADIGVDLALRLDADGHGLEFRVVDVGRDDHASGGDFVADELGGRRARARRRRASPR